MECYSLLAAVTQLLEGCKCMVEWFYLTWCQLQSAQCVRYRPTPVLGDTVDLYRHLFVVIVAPGKKYLGT